MRCLCLSCHFRTLLPFTCSDDSCLSLSHARGHPHALEILLCTVFLLDEASSCGCVFFSDLALCASWSAGTPRLRHVRKDRPVYMSGGAFLLSFSFGLHESLASFSRLPFTTVLRESQVFVSTFALSILPSIQGLSVVHAFCALSRGRRTL